jgi:hypothetical protein
LIHTSHIEHFSIADAVTNFATALTAENNFLHNKPKSTSSSMNAGQQVKGEH